MSHSTLSKYYISERIVSATYLILASYNTFNLFYVHLGFTDNGLFFIFSFLFNEWTNSIISPGRWKHYHVVSSSSQCEELLLCVYEMYTGSMFLGYIKKSRSCPLKIIWAKENTYYMILGLNQIPAWAKNHTVKLIFNRNMHFQRTLISFYNYKDKFLT